MVETIVDGNKLIVAKCANPALHFHGLIGRLRFAAGLDLCSLHKFYRGTKNDNLSFYSKKKNWYDYCILILNRKNDKFAVYSYAKLSLNQSLQQKLSPQQIQFIKLLQVPQPSWRTGLRRNWS